MDRSIQGFDPHDVESIDSDADLLYLGTDGTGAVHYWDKTDRTVYSFLEGEPHEAADLARRTLDWYVNDVEGRRGWNELNYDTRSLGEWLGDHLARIASGMEVA